jgi:hypothetical protein
MKPGFLRRRPVPEGIRITTVGLWFVLLTFLVAIAATNTGNNSLYTVLALMFAVLILSGILSRRVWCRAGSFSSRSHARRNRCLCRICRGGARAWGRSR